MSKKNNDNRKELLIRFEIDDKRRVSFIDPCCDDMPAMLLCKVLKAISDVETKWNNEIEKK